LKKFAPVLAVLALILGACAATDDTPAALNIPPVAFDHPQAEAAIQQANAALAAADYNAAAGAFQVALANWPVDESSWQGLSQAYGASGDVSGQNYALFFGERMEWANSLHPSAAAGAFENVLLMNEETPFQDTRIPDTARRLSAFYRQGLVETRARQSASFESQQTFGQNYLIYPVAVLSGWLILTHVRSKLTSPK